MQRLVSPFASLAWAALLVVAAAALAEPYSVRVEYDYRITGIQDPEGALNGAVLVGEEYGGYYTVDGSAPSEPTSPTDPKAIYYSDAELFAHETALGPFVHRSADALSGWPPLTVVVVCDGCPDWVRPPRDIYQAFHNAATTRTVTPSGGGDAYALLISRVALHLEDDLAQAIDTEVQPLWLDVADWPFLHAIWISGGVDLNHNGRIDRGPSPSEPGEPEFVVTGELVALRVVVDPAAMARELVDTIIDVNVANGNANASDPTLKLALTALDAVHAGKTAVAVHSLGALVHLLAARAGKVIPEDDAARLIALAEDIVAVLERAGES